MKGYRRVSVNKMVDDLSTALKKYHVIAVIGLSRNPEKYSYKVAEYLKSKGYTIIPVNPTISRVLEEQSYRSLLDLPDELQSKVEIVDIFRPPDAVPEILDQVFKLREKYGKPNVIWLQPGAVDETSARRAEEAGLTVIKNVCMMIEHRRAAN
jgi:predicted CoA-binding protein